MGKHDSGGPAFARPFSGNAEWPGHFWAQGGMTLLDYFAGQALAPIITASIAHGMSGQQLADHYASAAYVVAAAMVAEKRRREAEDTP